MTLSVGCNGLVVVLLCLCGSGLILSSTPETNQRHDKSPPVGQRLEETVPGDAAASRIPRTLAQPHPQHQQSAQQQQQQQQHVRVVRRSQKELPDMLMKERSSWRLAGSVPAADRWHEAVSLPVDHWQRMNVVRPAHNQVADDDEADAADEDEDESVDRLNWREAQLARLHGLGPAEIEALSSWQHRFKVHPLAKRLNQGKSLGGQSKTSQAYRPWMQLEPSHSIIVNDVVNRSNAVSADSPPLWSKRSFNNNNSNGKANKEGKAIKDKANNRNAANGNDPAAKGKGKSSRKQQQQQQAAAAAAAAAAVSSLDQQTSGGKDRPTLSQLPPVAVDGVSRMNRNLAAQFLLRSPRENRQYDVPIIGECARCLILCLSTNS